jgi:hypothetical protein
MIKRLRKKMNKENNTENKKRSRWHYDEDLTGIKFGKLTVIKRGGKTAKKRQKWDCRCECGRMTNATHGHLTNGNRKSCGYCRGNSIKDNCIVRVHGDTKRNASRKKRTKTINYKLTKQEVANLIFKPCHYCGRQPSNKFERSPIGCDRQVMFYNGIDRVDSDGDYEISNCVTCCKYCNWIKSDKSIKQMFKHVEKIYNHSIKSLTKKSK